jgi:hypothetical protein
LGAASILLHRHGDEIIDRTSVGFAALRMNTDLALSAQAFGFGAGLLSVGEAISCGRE